MKKITYLMLIIILTSCGNDSLDVYENEIREVHVPRASIVYSKMSKDTLKLAFTDNTSIRDPFIDDEVFKYLLFKSLEDSRKKFKVYTIEVDLKGSSVTETKHYDHETINKLTSRYKNANYLEIISVLFDDKDSREGLSYLFLLNYMYGYKLSGDHEEVDLYNENIFELLYSISSGDQEAKNTMNLILSDLNNKGSSNEETEKNIKIVVGKVEAILRKHLAAVHVPNSNE